MAKAEDNKRTTAMSEKAVPVQGKLGRNDPCPCGSGKKYKKCCITDVAPVIHECAHGCEH
jgi:uncharacterized protein YecA (UPF0149 family)